MYDINNQQHENNTRRFEDLYKALFLSVDQGFCIVEVTFDSDNTPIDYRFLEISPSFERQTGIKNGAGRLMREIAPDHDKYWFEVYGRVALTGEPARFDYFSTPLGLWWNVYAFRLEDPQLRHVGVLFNDITERKHAEERLAAAAARDQFRLRLADALRPLSDAVAIEGEATRVLGEYLGANRVVYFEVLGEDYVVKRDYTAGAPSIVGHFPISSFGPALLTAFLGGHTVMASDIAADLSLSPAERAAFHAIQIGSYVGVPLVKGNRFVAGLGVQTVEPRAWTPDEVSLVEETAERTWAAAERARAEERLQQLYAQEQAARAQAEDANRLKDEFLATVSHELRTPLTAFLGYAQLLLRRSRDEAYVNRTVEKMMQSAQSQAALIEDLLDMSRIVSSKLHIELTPIALMNVIHAALDTVRPSVDAKEITVQLELDSAGNQVLGDANRLQQVVWNLLSNAAKFTPKGGQIAIQLVSTGDQAMLTIRDTGLGIPEEFLPYVFDRFRQAESTSQRAYGGLGLGLAIVRHLVELHGGSVEAASAGEGKGATFTVWLPLASANQLHTKQPATAETGREAEQLSLQGLQILVVDDQLKILALLEEVLASEGAIVRTCSTAQDGLATLREWQPDVLVSDIAMPNEDGYWLIEQIRSLSAQDGGTTPAVALTAYVGMEDRLKVLAAGFEQYVTKPINLAELRNVILHLVAGNAT